MKEDNNTIDLSDLDPEVAEHFRRAVQIFATRAKSYGTDNIAEAGLSGVLARLRDKLARAEILIDGDEKERTVDTGMDLANYGIILSMLAAGTWPGVARKHALVVGSEGISEPQKPGDVGYDLRASRRTVVHPETLVMVPTGVRLSCPPGVWCEIRGRSSLLFNYGAMVPTNVIDTGYTGELRIPIMVERPWKTLVIKPGQRIAQVIFHRSVCPELEGVEVLPATTRGESGFGSTGEE